MKTPYFKKTTDSEGNEWVDSQDIFQYTDELGPFFNKWYQFIVRKCEQMNYYNSHTSTAYGNPDLSWLIGFCSGWLLAKGCYEDDKDGVCYIKDRQNKTIMKFDIPKVSRMESENRKELNKLIDEVFGGYPAMRARQRICSTRKEERSADSTKRPTVSKMVALSQPESHPCG